MVEVDGDESTAAEGDNDCLPTTFVVVADELFCISLYCFVGWAKSAALVGM